jgi:hypothetical protein
VASSNNIQRLAWRNDQHLYLLQTLAMILRAARQQAGQAVQPLEQFHVRFQVIDEGTVEQMTANLRQRRRQSTAHSWAAAARGWIIRKVVGNPHYQHAVGAQMQRWADRCALTHSAITKPLAIQLHRRKQQRDSGRGHQMIELQRCLYPDPTVPVPGHDPLMPLIETHRFR